MYRTVTAKVGLPGRLSKEFLIGIGTTEDELEIELTERISVRLNKKEILQAILETEPSDQPLIAEKVEEKP